MKTLLRRPPHPATDRWMVSYLDVLTILLIFFVAAAAESAMPHPTKEKTPEPHAELLQPQQKLAALGLDLKMEPRGLVISLPQTILFASGDDVVSAEARTTVEQIAAVPARDPE